MTPQFSRRPVAAGLLLLVTAVALAGCSRTNSGTPTSRGNEPAAAPGGAQADRELNGAPTDQQKGANPQAPAQIEPLQRSLIYTGSMTVAVTDVVKAANQATDIAVGAGGLVGSDQRTIDADRSTAQLTLRVPADRFSATLEELAKLGREESRAISTQDVTESLVDLDARLATQRASVDRVRALLAQAKTIGEVVSIESELTRREADLDSLKQRREKLSGLVALSTISLTLHGPAAVVVKPAEETGFVAGLKSGWKGFLASVAIVLTVAGWMLPWVIAIGVPIWFLVWLVRRRNRRTRVRLYPPPPPSAPAA
jgi:Domain of unknown function (DUF4349)